MFVIQQKNAAGVNLATVSLKQIKKSINYNARMVVFALVTAQIMDPIHGNAAMERKALMAS